jgi:hypothetical protein
VPSYQPPSSDAVLTSLGDSNGFTLARKEEAVPVLPGGAYLQGQTQPTNRLAQIMSNLNATSHHVTVRYVYCKLMP